MNGSVFRATERPLPRNPLAFFRGIGPASLQGALVYGVLLGAYESFRTAGFSLPVASGISTVFESIVRGPLEVIKNLQQTVLRPTGPQLAMTMINGTVGTAIREIPNNLLYFGCFEFFRQRKVAVLDGDVDR